MRIQLDDNQRGAVHYLLGGVLVVCAVRGLAWALEVFGPAPTPTGAVLRPFQHGYWGMRNELAVVSSTAGLSERMVLAVVCAVGASVAMALAAAAFLRKWPCAGIWLARTTLVLVLAWALYAALMLPMKESRIVDGMLVVTTRRSIVGDIPAPFSARQQRCSRSRIARIQVKEVPPVQGCDGRILLEKVVHEGKPPEAMAAEIGVCPEQRLARLRNGSEAAALLERELR